jgi:ATP-dependent Clp protease ATP-binding subunit ClpC
MFERYTEKARRVIFFARYEASQFGSPYIETEHLLLGILREHKGIARLLPRVEAESIRAQIEAATPRRVPSSTSVDLPLSNEGKRVLAYGAQEAERLNHRHIGTEHLLLGLLREENCFAARLLVERGAVLAELRAGIEKEPEQPFEPRARGAVDRPLKRSGYDSNSRQDAKCRPHSRSREALPRVFVALAEARFECPGYRDPPQEWRDFL